MENFWMYQVEKLEEEQAKQRQDADPQDQNEPPRLDSPPPPGAEMSSRLLLQDDNLEASASSKESRKIPPTFPAYVEVPGPCDPEDLISGILFAAIYRGSTPLLSEKTPSRSVRTKQAEEAVNRIKVGKASQMEVDLFISTQRVKVLNTDSQETVMDQPLRSVVYIADIGNVVVLMVRRRPPQLDSQESQEAPDPGEDGKSPSRMTCHVFESEDAQMIAQSIGQAFSVAYQEFLRVSGINPRDLSQREYSDMLSSPDMYNEDLVHFSKSENSRAVSIEKERGEILGLAIVESGWGSILPTAIIANMMHGGPAERSGKLNTGDQIMSVNGTSLVGLPLSSCQNIIKDLKNQTRVQMNVVRCPPVTTVLIRRPALRLQLGFSVQNGIICSLVRGGIAERGGVRVGHRIIEINGQSVVATPHEKIVHILSNAVGKIHMKTMPAAMYRLLTAQEQPLFI
ncbi:amyloid-beta A4 precursor protein-binding family A member 1 [Oryzias melastigma]|uniref:amyloid-beta A4 precursor protein-binding family A member 1 n=1 Tax=Oryzias melastigma TaxID=30732 RepID=UPI000CF82CF4|nr:amyloid-beta A4 precursor protein-binding family A member 1 [Oryzias melastigma]